MQKCIDGSLPQRGSREGLCISIREGGHWGCVEGPSSRIEKAENRVQPRPTTLMTQPNPQTLTVGIKSSLLLTIFLLVCKLRGAPSYLYSRLTCPFISCHRLLHLSERKSRACLVTSYLWFIRDAILVEFIMKGWSQQDLNSSTGQQCFVSGSAWC